MWCLFIGSELFDYTHVYQNLKETRAGVCETPTPPIKVKVTGKGYRVKFLYGWKGLDTRKTYAKFERVIFFLLHSTCKSLTTT